MSAALALQLDVGAQAGDEPAVGAAGVGFFELDDVAQLEILDRHDHIVKQTG